MTDINSFLAALKDVATSPLALVGYVLLVAAWAWVTVKTHRLRVVAKAIKLSPEQGLELLKNEYRTEPRAGVTPEQWLKSRRQAYMLVGFLATVVAAVLVVALVIFRPSRTGSASTPPRLVDPVPVALPDGGSQSAVQKTPPEVMSTRAIGGPADESTQISDFGLVTVIRLFRESSESVPKQRQIFDVTIANASRSAFLPKDFIIYYKYENGFQMSIDNSRSLSAVDVYYVKMDIDTDKDGLEMTKTVPVYPSVIVGPGSSSDPGLLTIRLTVDYSLTGRLKYHPNFDWNILYHVEATDDAGRRVILVPERRWR
ncbi:MAG: hypothetical protein ACKVW3_03735 [Phycisphaerales bacterium]